MDNTEVTVIESDNTALYLITKAEIDTQIATAKAFPRSIKVFFDKAKSMATVSQEIAASCSYSVPRGGKVIEGASIRLAEIISSTYGNIRSGARVIANDGKQITAQGICHDLETNNCVTVEVKRKITGKDGRTFNEDIQTLTGNAACSIAMRNAIFKVIPLAMVNEIREAAKLCARGNLADLASRRKTAVEYFKSLKVTEKQIFDILEVKGMEEIDLDKLQILTGMKSAIVNEGMKASELFEKKPDVANPAVEAQPLSVAELLESCDTLDKIEFLKMGNPNLTAEEMKLVDAKAGELLKASKKK